MYIYTRVHKKTWLKEATRIWGLYTILIGNREGHRGTSERTNGFLEGGKEGTYGRRNAFLERLMGP